MEASSKVYTWGRNSDGQLGLPIKKVTKQSHAEIEMLPKRVIEGDAIGTFNNYTVVLKDGKLYGCGNNRKDRLGLGGTDKIFKPLPMPFKPTVLKVACGASHLVLLDTNYNAYDRFKQVEGTF